MVYRSADDEGASTLKGYMPDLAARDCERRFDSGGRRLDITLVQCILESGYALAMIAGWHPNV
jgi:hypothetical protein